MGSGADRSPASGSSFDDAVEAEIYRLLESRDAMASICPSEVARSLGKGEDWRLLMDPVRAVAGRLAAQGHIRITQGGSTVDIATSTGPVRIRRV